MLISIPVPQIGPSPRDAAPRRRPPNTPPYPRLHPGSSSFWGHGSRRFRDFGRLRDACTTARVAGTRTAVQCVLHLPIRQEGPKHDRMIGPDSCSRVESKVGAVATGPGSCCYRRLSPFRRCLSPLHCSVSHLRSSNRTCASNASGSPTDFTWQPTTSASCCGGAVCGPRSCCR